MNRASDFNRTHARPWETLWRDGALHSDTADRKIARLRRMQHTATALLGLMGALWGASIWFSHDIPMLAWLQAFTEAGLVGGFADWFAVVALFRHPLGLKLPHTAIVPENKARIGAALGQFVEEYFLTPDNVAARLDELDLVGDLFRSLADRDNGRVLARSIRQFLPTIITILDMPEIQTVVRRAIAAELDRLDADSLVATLLEALSNDQQAPPQALSARKGHHLIRRRLRAETPNAYEPLENYYLERLITVVSDLIDMAFEGPRQIINTEMSAYLLQVLQRLSRGSATDQRLGRFKQLLLARIGSGTMVTALLQDVSKQLADMEPGKATVLEEQFAAAIADFSAQALKDPQLMFDISRDVRALIRSGLERYGRQIGHLIEQVVHRWKADEISKTIEREVGPDLQYIRLNGTLLGGLVGIALHAALLFMSR